MSVSWSNAGSSVVVSGDLFLSTGTASVGTCGVVSIGSGSSASGSGGSIAVSVGPGDGSGGTFSVTAGDSLGANDGVAHFCSRARIKEFPSPASYPINSAG